MKLENKKAYFNYQILEKIEAGIILKGGEAHAIRYGRINLNNSYAKIIGNEVFLINADIPIPGAKNYTSTHMRKLLLKRSEIRNIELKIKEKKLTIVPTKVYNKGQLVKVELALAKTKREFEKRETIKKRDVLRDLEQSRLNRD